MDHLSEEQLYEVVFAKSKVPEEAEYHIQNCTECRQQLLTIGRLARELEISRRSQPTSDQLERYFQLFPDIKGTSSPWTRLSTHLQMVLAQDGRYRMGLQGLRGTGPRSYRLLYSARTADVELLVETHGHGRRIQGEVLPFDDAPLRSPVLVELRLAEKRSKHIDLVAESNEQGRFQFDGIALGYYQLTVTPTEGPALRIEGIDIT